MPKYLLRFAQVHENFRLAELKALAEMEGIEMGIERYSEYSPFTILTLPSSQAATRLISRSVLVQSIHELWGTGSTYAELHASIETSPIAAELIPLYKNSSFKFSFDSYQGSRSMQEQKEIIEGFKWLGFEGRIVMRHPDESWGVFEEWEEEGGEEEGVNRVEKRREGGDDGKDEAQRKKGRGKRQRAARKEREKGGDRDRAQDGSGALKAAPSLAQYDEKASEELPPATASEYDLAAAVSDPLSHLSSPSVCNTSPLSAPPENLNTSTTLPSSTSSFIPTTSPTTKIPSSTTESSSVPPPPPQTSTQKLTTNNNTLFPSQVPIKPPPLLSTLFFARHLSTSHRSEVLNLYTLKKRNYLATTSMDAELSLIMANIAHARPESLFYDPFLGTGSLTVACAHFGAVVWGSDIDGRMVRGVGGGKGGEEKGDRREREGEGVKSVSSVGKEKKKREKRDGRDRGFRKEEEGDGNEEEKRIVSVKGGGGRGVREAYRQYGLQGRDLGAFVGDLVNGGLRGWSGPESGLEEGVERRGEGRDKGRDGTGSILNGKGLPRRRGEWLDGIVCDPPYGVREGLRVLGRRDGEKKEVQYMADGTPCHLAPNYIPPRKPYSFTALLRDILSFAAATLVPDGRLAFWMPSANDQDESLDIPMHPRLELVCVCVQPFYKWSRRLLVYRKRRRGEGDTVVGKEEGIVGDGEVSLNGSGSKVEGGGKGLEKGKGKSADELNAFRRRYFQGFRSEDRAE